MGDLQSSASKLEGRSRVQRSRTSANVGGESILEFSQSPATMAATPQPFLKWAGGKRALLPEIRARVPEFAGRYIEPFLGAGAVFFDQKPERMKIVSDFNEDLVEVYEAIRDHPQGLMEALRKHSNTKEHYYTVRAWDREPNFKSRSKIERAARFIFLNKTNYNGLYRVNASGQMNVPFGDQKNPDWLQEDVIHSVSDYLNAASSDGTLATKFISGDYRLALGHAVPGDWIYLDPPYADTFTHYQSGGFNIQDQTELRDQVISLTQRGIPVLLSNSDVPVIRALYGDSEVFTIETVKVRRAIGAALSSRRLVNEVLISNYSAVGL
jgi:DNA adenine methylase